MLLGHVVLILGEVFITGDGYDLNLWHALLQGLQAGHLFDAGSAPAGPEVQDDDLAAKAAKINGMLTIADGEDGRDASELVGDPGPDRSLSLMVQARN